MTTSRWILLSLAFLTAILLVEDVAKCQDAAQTLPEACFGPMTGKIGPCSTVVSGMILTAQRRVDIAVPTLTQPAIVEALVHVRAQKIRVRIIAARVAKDLKPWTRSPRVPDFRHGFVIIDDVVLHGSLNMGVEMNLTAGGLVILRAPGWAEVFTEVFEALWVQK